MGQTLILCQYFGTRHQKKRYVSSPSKQAQVQHRTAIHSKQINPSQLKGFAAGLGGAAVNVGIGIVADNNIDDYKKEASDENKNANNDDKLNSINVVSIQG